MRTGRDKLHGIVEVDETLVGGEDKGGKRGRGAEKKSIVVIALEIHEPIGYGRVRMKRVSDFSSNSLIPFVRDVVQSGSVVRTVLTVGVVTTNLKAWIISMKRQTLPHQMILPMY